MAAQMTGALHSDLLLPMFCPDIFLADAVKQSSSLMVLVLGTQCGYSAIRVLSLLPPDGKVYAVEEEDSMAESAEEMILVSGFKNNQVLKNIADNTLK